VWTVLWQQQLFVVRFTPPISLHSDRFDHGDTNAIISLPLNPRHHNSLDEETLTQEEDRDDRDHGEDTGGHQEMF